MATRDIIVGAAQYAPVLGDVSGNLTKSLAYMNEAAARGVRLLVLPECCLSGYYLDDRLHALALSDRLDGPNIAVWKEQAAKLDLTLVAGIIERADDEIFDSAIVVTPLGQVTSYRKVHLWGIERDLYQPGHQAVVVESPLARIGIAICYDLWFPEFSRRLVLDGAEIIVSPANWAGNPRMRDPLDNHGQAMGFHMARTTACVNEVPLIAADRIGQEEPLTFLGNSCIIDGSGQILAGPVSHVEERLITATVRVGPSDAVTQSHMASRRPNVYASQAQEERR